MRVWLNRYVYGILLVAAGVVGLYIALNRMPESLTTSLTATGLLDKQIGAMIGRELSLLVGLVVINCALMLFFLGYGCKWVFLGIYRLLVDIAGDDQLGEWADGGKSSDADGK